LDHLPLTNMDQLKDKVAAEVAAVVEAAVEALLKLRLNSSSSFRGRGIAGFTGRENLKKELVSANLMK
jgi:hypothetical protein